MLAHSKSSQNELRAALARAPLSPGLRNEKPSAAVELQVPSARYELGAVTNSNDGNRVLVTSMATTVRDTLNGLIEMVTHGDERATVSNIAPWLPNQKYGHTGGQLWVQYDSNLDGSINTSINSASNPGGERFAVNSADEAVDKGVLFAIPRTQIIGGDLFLKRALYNLSSSDPTRPKAPNVAALGGDLQIAEDYAFYLQNRAIIDAMIAEPYTSMKLASVDYEHSTTAVNDNRPVGSQGYLNVA